MIRLATAVTFLATAVAASAQIENPKSKIENRTSLSVAAASNLVYALDALNAEFRRSAPEITLTVATGASGNLVAQITNGAPYDIFLSDDLDYPRALIAQGGADAKTLTVFSIGRLVLWTTRANLDVSDPAATVRNPAIRKIAVANPATAPYGRAAQQALEKLGAWSAARPKIVTGENVTQTAQFVETGHADAGFVALSLVLSPKLKDRGRWAEVPATLYAPLEQGAIITARGTQNPAAARYLAFLGSPAARKILQNFGYALPAK
jgi:molybdate transport system substrate-binding protein